MKQSAYLLIIFSFCGCKFFPLLDLGRSESKSGIHYTLLIENNTSVDINIQSYYKGKSMDKISIKNSETFRKEVIYYSSSQIIGFKNREVFSDELDGFRDSLIINLGGKKTITQLNFNPAKGPYNPTPKELFLMARPVNSTNNLPRAKRDTKGIVGIMGPYKITFTKEDYDAALPIRQ